jgi:hypothetical protein
MDMNILPKKVVVTFIMTLITIGNLFSQETCKYHLTSKEVNHIKVKFNKNDKINQTLCFKNNYKECYEVYQDGLMFDESLVGIVAVLCNHQTDGRFLQYNVCFIDYYEDSPKASLIKDEAWTISKDYSIVSESKKEGKKIIVLVYKRTSTEPNDY